MAADHDVLDPEVVDDGPNALQLRNPQVSVTVNDLAERKGEGHEILEARAQILNTARRHAIHVTHPEDWVLFKSKDERIVGYLGDAGCERARPIFAIRIYPEGEPTKVVANDGKSFAIITHGRGTCGLTLDHVEGAEGIRDSMEDFAKDLVGIKQEMRVRQASRANLDGRIVRELAGLSSVPIEELARVWAGTEKKVEHCRKGRGFGTQDERHGGTRAGEPDVEPPVCEVCGTKGAVRKGKDGKPDWYGCPNYTNHPAGRKWSIDVDKWIAQLKAKAQQPSAPQQQSPAPQASASSKPASRQQQQQPSRPAPVQADSIFGRDPGEEG